MENTENTTAAVEAAAADPMPQAAEQQPDTTPAPEATPAQQAQGDPFNFPAPPEGEAPKAEEPPKAAAPEKYEFHLPEGLSMTPEIEARFTEIAKGIGLTQEQADGLVKLHSDLMLGAMRQAEEQKIAWANECHRAGLTAPEKIKTAKLAIDIFDDSGKVMQELVESGLAYSPNMQRFLQTIGGYLKEDTAPDSKPAAQAKSAADLLFGNSKY